MTAATTAHPSAQLLNAFALGRLDEAQSAAIEAHLATCLACQRLVEDTPDDSLVETLQAPVPELAPAPAPVVESAESVESRPGLFKRLAAIVEPQAPKPAQPPAARSHQDVPAALRNHPRYEVLERLGAGGMGTVFKARHRLMDRVVALKVMNPLLLADPVAIGRFQREVKAAAQLAHPHIVTAYDAEQTGGLHFLVMEFVEGHTLAEIVDQRGPLPTHEACEYIRQAALGLQYAHQRGMVHRDIKPQNLVLTPTGQVKVFDFGLARFVSESGEPGEGSSSGRMLGSPDYMAPEQAKDAHAADIRADIYSLGCTLYQLLVGLPPFAGGTPIEKLAAHLEKTPIEISQLRPDASADLESVVGRMLAKDPEQRFQTPGEVAAALEPLCHPQPAAAPAAQPVAAAQPAPAAQPKGDSLAPALRGEDWGEGRNRLRRTRRSVGAWAGALTLLLALGIVGFFYGAAIYRFVTDQGTLVIQTDDPDVEVIVKQGGKQVTIVDTKTRREVALKTGEYQLELAQGQEGLKLSTQQFTLSRGDREIARVWMEKTEPEPLAATPATPEAVEPTLPGGSPKVVAPTPVDSPAPQSPAPLADIDPRYAEYFRKLIAVWDANQDGELTPNEWANMTRNPEAADVDQNGRITVEEYARWSLSRTRDDAPPPPPSATAAVSLLEIRSLLGHRLPVHAVAVSADGRLVLSGSQDKTARLWDVFSGQQIARWDHAEPVQAVALDPSGVRALTASGNLIRLWDVASGTELGQFAGHAGPVQCVAFSPDGQQAVSGSQDTTVRVWRVEGRRERRVLSGHQKPITSVAFAHDGKQVLSGSLDGMLQLWDIETGKPRRLGTHTGGVRGVALSPDGDSALSGGVNRLLSLWDVTSGELKLAFSTRSRRTASLPSSTLPAPVNCVALSADGRRALSGDGAVSTTSRTLPDARVRLWDVASGSELVHSEACGSFVSSVAFSGDGRLAAAAGQDKAVRLFWLAEAGGAGLGETDTVPRDRSLLVLDKDAPDLPLVVKQAGRLVAVLSAKASPSSLLKPGDYDLELAELSDEFQLDAYKLTLKAGEKQTVAIRPVPENPPPAQLAEIRRFDAGGVYGVDTMAMSADGKVALFPGKDNLFRAWDVTSGQEQRRFEGTEKVVDVSLSPDGRLAITGGPDKTIRLWEVATGKELRQFTGSNGDIFASTFSPDGRLALSGGADGLVSVWEVDTGKLLRSFQGHGGSIYGVAFSPDGRLALSSSWEDATVRLWDVQTGQELRQLDGHTEPIGLVAFSPDGRLALTGSEDRTMRLWDVATGRQLRVYRHSTGVCSVAFSPDGRRVLSGSGTKLQSEVNSVPAGHDYTVRLWDVERGDLLAQASDFGGPVLNVACTPDGRSVLAASMDGTVRLLKLPDPPGLPITEVRSFGQSSGLFSAKLSPDGRYVLSSNHVEQALRLWDVTSGQEVRRFEGSCEGSHLAFSPDGRLALSGSYGVIKDGRWVSADYSLRLWDVATGKELRRFLGHTVSVTGLAFTPDGRQALSASDDSTLRLWDVQTGRPLRVFQGHESTIASMGLSADGRLAISGGGDKTVRLWDVATGRELRRLDGHAKAITGVAISPDGRRVLSGGDDKTMRLWDVESGQQVRLFSRHSVPAGYSVAFSPDGQRMLCSLDDRTVRLWEVATGHEQARFDGFTDVIRGAFFSHDGRSALAYDLNATIRLLKLPAADEELPSSVTGDAGQLAVESEAADGWLLVKQRDKVVQVLDATASQTVDLSVGEYQLELAGRTDNLRLSADKVTLAKGAKQAVQISRVSKPARVELTAFRSLVGHRSHAGGAHISPDGRYLLSCSPDETIRLWDVVTGKEVRRFEGREGPVDDAAFSPDGRLVAAGFGDTFRGGKPQGSDFSVWLWDTATGEVVQRFEGHTGRVRGVAISPDNHSLATASWDWTVRLWDIPGNQLRHTLKGHDPANAVAFSPDGRLVLSGGWRDATVRLWDARSGQELHALKAHGDHVRSIAFSPDGSLAVSASADRTMRLWDLKAGRLQFTFPLQATHVNAAAFSPDGMRIVSANDDRHVRVWDVRTKEETGSFDCSPDVPWRAEWSPDGRFIACSGKTMRVLWISETGEVQKPASNADNGQLAVETNGFDLPIIVTQPDKLVTVIVPKVSKVAELPPGEYELELAGQPDDFRLSADKVTLAKGQTQTISIQEVPPVEPPHEITEVRRFEGHTAVIESVAFSPDGRWALSGGQDKTVRLWDVETGKEVRQFENTQDIRCVAFSPDGRQALSGGTDAANPGDFAIRLWNVDTGKEIHRFTGHTGEVRMAVFSPDGSRVASCSFDRTVRIWDAKTGTELKKFTGHDAEVWRVAFSPDGRQVLSGGHDAMLRLWDIETAQEVRRFEGHTEQIAGAAFSPDGRQAVSCAGDRSVRLWDVETGRQLRSFSGCRTSENLVTFSPDGRRILSGSGWGPGGHRHAGFDYGVRLRDVATGEVLGCFEGHTAPVVTVAFSPDGRTALSAGYDNVIRLLKLPEPPSLPMTEVGSFAVPSPSGWLNLALSPDSRYALSSDQYDQTFRLWDTNTGQEVRRFEGVCESSVLAFSPDGRLALSGSLNAMKDGVWVRPDYSLRLWDVATGKEVRRFSGHTASLRGVAFTPDARQVLSAGYDSTLRLWDVQSGRLVRVFQGQAPITAMDLSADGRLAVSAGSDNIVRLWDVATGRELRRLEGHTKAISGVAVSPDGRRILSAGEDKTIRLSDVETGRQVRLFPVHPFAQSVAFSPDGRHAITGSWYSGATTRVWDVATGHEVSRFEGAAVYCCAGTSALASAGGALRLLKLPPADQSLPSTITGDAGQLAVESEAADGWLLVKQRDKVVLVLDATASQTVDLSVGEYQLELAGRTENLRLSAETFALAKDAKQAVQIRRENEPARVELTEFRSFAGHQVGPARVCFSPDGRYLVSCSWDTTVRLWDVLTGKEVRRFEGQGTTVDCVVFSPDGRFVAGGGGHPWKEGQKADYTVWLWEVATGKLVHRFEGHTAVVIEATISRDGQCLATCSNDGTIRLWDLPGRQIRHVLKGDGLFNVAAFSIDGRSLVSAGTDGKLRLWDTELGTQLDVWEGVGESAAHKALSPDGTQFLTGDADRTMRLWDAKTGRLQSTSFSRSTGPEWSTFSPDGKRVAFANWYGNTVSRVRLWDVDAREEIGSFDLETAAARRAAWSPDGRVVACTGKVVQLLWLTETGEGQKHTSNPDDGQLAIETNGFDLPVIVKQPEKLVTVIVPKISTIAELPPGEYELELAGQPEDFRLSADKVTLAKGQTQTISIQEVPPVEPPHEITEIRRFEGHSSYIESVAFSPDGRWALSGGLDKTVRLWEVDTGKEVRQFEGNTETIFTVAFSPDGRLAVSAGDDAGNRDFAIRLWDVETGKEVRHFTGHTDRIRLARFSPDGTRLLSCSLDRTIRLWDVQAGTELRQFTGHESAVERLAFAPDGRSALSCGADATIRLWDLETGKELRRFEGHTECIGGMAFSPDGRQAVSCAMDRSVRLWDVETGHQLRSFSGCQTSENLVTFSPDGRRILTGTGWRPTNRPAGFDYGVRLRDVATGEVLACSEGDRSPVVTVAFSPDGRTALSAGYDNVIRLLKLPEPDADQAAAPEE